MEHLPGQNSEKTPRAKYKYGLLRNIINTLDQTEFCETARAEFQDAESAIRMGQHLEKLPAPKLKTRQN